MNNPKYKVKTSGFTTDLSFATLYSFIFIEKKLACDEYFLDMVGIISMSRKGFEPMVSRAIKRSVGPGARSTFELSYLKQPL